jgi:hypothetical protein
VALAGRGAAHPATPLPPLIGRQQLMRWGEDARRHSGHETTPEPRLRRQPVPAG